jgi:hypothetical protein
LLVAVYDWPDQLMCPSLTQSHHQG